MPGTERDDEPVAPEDVAVIPRGRLSQRRIEAVQTRIVRGLVGEGYTRPQVGQVLRVSPNTILRRLAGSKKAYV